MGDSLDFFTDFLAMMALEKVTGERLVPIPQLTEKQKREISEDAFRKVYEAIYSPIDPRYDLDDDEREDAEGDR